MSKRTALRDRAEFVFARVFLFCLERAPLFAARRLASGLAGLAYRLTPAWRRVGRRNLEIAFPQRSSFEREAILRGSYQNLGRVVLALARTPRLNNANISDWIEYDGLDHFLEAERLGSGTIFLTAHLGNWELSSTAHALYGHPMDVVTRRLDNPLLDRLVQGRRTVNGNGVIEKTSSAGKILRALRASRAVGVLADQNTAGDDGLFVDLFGTPASATKGVALLAAHSGAAVVPGFAFWLQETQRYSLKFYPALEMVSTGDRAADLVENTRRCQAAIEAAIREHPDQWLWIHRRWKRRPEGEPPIY